MNIMMIVFLTELALAGIVYGIAFRRCRNLMERLPERFRSEFKLHRLAPLSLIWFDKLRLFQSASPWLAAVHYRMIPLYGQRLAVQLGKVFIAYSCSLGILLFMLCTVLGAVAGDDLSFILYGLLLGALCPYVLLRQLDRRMKRHKQMMILALPQFLNQVALLVGAGENIAGAIRRCSEEQEHNDNRESDPLRRELWTTAAQLANQLPFQQVMADLSKRCQQMEVTLFTTTVLLNYRRGGEHFALALRNLSRELWEKRKAISRTVGEEASARLIFPMVLIFMIVMIVVAAPAIMLMSESTIS